MQPLDAPEVTFGDTTFYIGKMLPVEAKQVFLAHVRPLFRGALSADIKDGNDWQIFVAAFTDAPQAEYDSLTRALYRHVTYKSPNQPAPMPLLGDEENAFAGLDMVHILAVDARSFYRNFRGSWDVLRSMFPAIGPALQSLVRQTQTLSSGIPSPQDISAGQT